MADSLYGSDDNCERAKEHNVELIAPTMGSVKEDKLSLADFNQKGELIECPQGNPPAKSKRKKDLALRLLYSIASTALIIQKCPVKKGKKYYYLRFTKKKCA